MSLVIATAALAFFQAPTAADPAVDVAYEELVSAQNEAAIARIEGNADLDKDDPARQINLAIAHAREGRLAEARELLGGAANSEMRYQLETSKGEWVDSRHLALKVLAMIDDGEFGTASRVASR